MKRGFNFGFSLLKESFLIILGILVAGFGLKGFLAPNGFIDGGITGVSLLISHITPISVSLTIFVLNLPFIWLARKQVGKIFAMKTFLAILGLSLCLIFVKYPIITSDKLLVSVFGGFLLGAGIGLSVRGGSVIDGTEVLSIYLNKKTGFSMGEIIFVINVIIFSFAAVLLSIEAALYSILIYLIASKTVDFFIQGLEEYIGITIISQKNEEIRKKLVTEFGKGATIYKGKTGYSSGKEIDILFVFVTRLEVVRIKQEILSIDPRAVILEQGIKEVTGGVIKRRPLH
ncbi:YitT family protein [Candidatus Pacearchaeota archaeon]|nr:YitT family protein [Candidatus Pacearchaeota archaeon]